MAETATDTTSSGPPDIGAIVGTDKSALDDLTKIERQRVTEETRITKDVESGITRDQARLERAYRSEGISPNELKPWDADKEHRRFESDPLEGFGSLGAVFAMVASAFTHAPMQNAINGMAGALNAIKEGNEEAYTRAYDSYKENNKLALERHKIMHEQYQDALSLMQTNMAAGQAKLRLLATRFGDMQTLSLLEHGYSEELFKLQDARVNSATKLQQYTDTITESELRRKAYEAEIADIPKTQNPNLDAARKLEAWQRTHGVDSKDPKQQLMGLWFKQHANDNDGKGPSAEEAAEYAASIGIIGRFDPKAYAYQQMIQKWYSENPGQEMPQDVHKKILEDSGNIRIPLSGTAKEPGSESSQVRKSRAIKEIQDKHAAEGKPISIADAEKEYNNTVQIPTAHDRYRTEAQYQKVQRAEQTIDNIEGLLLKHKAIAGLGGTFTRPLEAVSNILGSNETDRRQFERWVLEMQEWGPQILNDREGKPLSSEAAKLSGIIAGLRPGDTTANTLRAYAEMRPLLQTIKKDLRDRYQSTGPLSGQRPGADAPKSEPPPAKDPNWYKNYPAVGGDKRSSLDEGRVMSDADPEPIRPGAKYAQNVVHFSGRRPDYENGQYASTPDEVAADVRHYGDVRGDPRDETVQKLLKNLPSDIIAIPEDETAIRLKYRPLTS